MANSFFVEKIQFNSSLIRSASLRTTLTLSPKTIVLSCYNHYHYKWFYEYVIINNSNANDSGVLHSKIYYYNRPSTRLKLFLCGRRVQEFWQSGFFFNTTCITNKYLREERQRFGYFKKKSKDNLKIAIEIIKVPVENWTLLTISWALVVEKLVSTDCFRWLKHLLKQTSSYGAIQ